MFGGQHLFLHGTAKVRSVNHNSSRTDMTFLAEERSSEIFIRTPPPGFRIDVGNLRRFSIWASMMANDHPFPKKDLDAVLESLFQYRIDSWIGAHISSDHPIQSFPQEKNWSHHWSQCFPIWWRENLHILDAIAFNPEKNWPVRLD